MGRSRNTKSQLTAPPRGRGGHRGVCDLLTWPCTVREEPHRVRPISDVPDETDPLAPASHFVLLGRTGKTIGVPSDVEWGRAGILARTVVCEVVKHAWFATSNSDVAFLRALEIKNLFRPWFRSYLAILVHKLKMTIPDGKTYTERLSKTHMWFATMLETPVEAGVFLPLSPGVAAFSEKMGVPDYSVMEELHTSCAYIASLVRKCPTFMMEFLVKEYSGIQMREIDEFSRICAKAICDEHPHWYTRIRGGLESAFTMVSADEAATREVIERLIRNYGDAPASSSEDPPERPRNPSPAEVENTAVENARIVETESVPQSEPRRSTDVSDMQCPLVDTVLSLCRNRGCVCIRRAVDTPPSNDTDKVVSMLSNMTVHGSSTRHATETRIRTALTPDYIKVLPFSIIGTMFPVSFLDEPVWKDLIEVVQTSEAIVFDEQEAGACALNQSGECTNWKTLVRAFKLDA